MKYLNYKNSILIALVVLCVYLSSNVWLELPEFLVNKTKADEKPKDNTATKTDIWHVVRPVKSILKHGENYTVSFSDEYNLWDKTVIILIGAINNFNKANIETAIVFPTEYVKFDFNTKIPIEIFTGRLYLTNKDFSGTIKYIKNIIIDLDNKNSLYIYDGEKTFKIENSLVNAQEIINIVKNYNFAKKTKYAFQEKVAEEILQIPVPLEITALNPVFVQSELDVFDTEKINKIAKNYFKNNYDYVRKSVDIRGNLVYLYKTEKVLRINEEGLLDFYDATVNLNKKTNLYDSFMIAVNFIDQFLGFPNDGYLNSVEEMEFDGSHGYRYTFSYKILDRPILFSKVRENLALQVDVSGGSVISYKRFIRNIDEKQMNKMNNMDVLPVLEVINKNLSSSENETNKINKDTKINQEMKPLKKEMIKEITNIYLSYFDISRVSKEQMLRVVWIIEINNKSFIFNAITGALIEEW